MPPCGRGKAAQGLPRDRAMSAAGGAFGALLHVLRNFKDELFSDHVLMLGAGMAFYGLFGVLPALSAAAALWNLFGDPAALKAAVSSTGSMIPGGSQSVLVQFVTSIPSGFGTGLGLVANLALVLYTSYQAASGMLTALNIVYDEDEKRSRLWRAALNLLIGSSGILVLLAALAVLAMPVVAGSSALLWVRWPLLACVFIPALGALFTFGPSRSGRNGSRHWAGIAWGTLSATALWTAATFGVSVYVRYVGSFGKFYGSLGTIILILFWFYYCAIAVLAGAEIDASLSEHAGVHRRGSLHAEIRRRERR